MIKLIKGLALKYADDKKILIFHIYFFNMDISLNMILTCLQTAVHVPEIHLEGGVSQWLL